MNKVIKLQFKHNNFLVTTCGHCFHNACIRNWFNTSRTCAFCRQSSSASSLIKVYFENTDDSKIGDLHNELLTANTKLIKERDDLKEQNRLQSDEIREVSSKLMSAQEELKKLERTKQLDDMALAGFRAIKEESEKEIIRLKEQNNTLALDLLAERQLRRVHQTTLKKLTPDNPDYDVLAILNDESLAQKPSQSGDKNRHYSITPFWQLNCEASKTGAIPKEISKEKNKPYIIPSKIQKGDAKILPIEQSKTMPEFRFRQHYKASIMHRENAIDLSRPRSSSPVQAFSMALTPFPQFQFGDKKPSIPQPSSNLFKFGDGSAGSSNAFRGESSNSKNGFQLLSSAQHFSGQNFASSSSNDRYREQMGGTSSDNPSSSSKKFSFAQKISDR